MQGALRSQSSTTHTAAVEGLSTRPDDTGKGRIVKYHDEGEKRFGRWLVNM